MKDVFNELYERRLIGGMLANCAFNLSQQRARLPDGACEILKELQRKWDAIKCAKGTTPKKKRKLSDGGKG